MKCLSQLLKLIFLVAIILFLATDVQGQQIAINEFMSSNSTTIADEDGDFEDWIEIYNYGKSAVNLSGYGLSDSYGDPFRWEFPVVIIEPGGYLLVWASGKDRRNPEMPLHTNFSIKAEGEELLFTHPSAAIIDHIQPVALPTDLSYGRKPNGLGQFFFFDEPTPAHSNTSQGFDEILSPPEFSHIGGFYPDAFELILSHPDPDAIIYFTVDASFPDTANLEATLYYYKNQYAVYPEEELGEFLTGSYQTETYFEPIQINDKSENEDRLTHISSTVHAPYYFPATPVKKATVVRAKAFKEGALSSCTATHTYFITTNIGNPSNMPVLALSIQENHLFDYDNGIYTAGVDADEWRINNPDEMMLWQFPGNFMRNGDDREYPLHLELIESGSQLRDFYQDLGFRIHGGGTKAFPMKSLRLYARSKYGESELNYPFFPNQPYNSYKRIILRNSGNDFPTTVWWNPTNTSRTMFRDAAIQTIVNDLKFETQAYRPAIVYLNGEYWGIHNMRERIDKYYLERVFGVDPENIDLIETVSEVIEGDNVFNDQMRQYIDQYGLEVDDHYQYIQTCIETENFTDYHIANIYVCNTDWPGNNVKFWRLRTNNYNPDAPYGHDGRFRWVMFDTDFGFGLWDNYSAFQFNTLSFATEAGGSEWPNPDITTFLLRNFLENEHFKNDFINRFADLINTTFKPERVVEIINDIKLTLEPEIPEHINRWGYYQSADDWNDNIQVMINFANERPAYQRQHIIDHFGLDGQYELTVDVSNQWHGFIKVNTIEINENTPSIHFHPYPWSGIYFKGVPIQIEAIANQGYVFSHWAGDASGNEPNITLTPEGDFSVVAHFVRDFSSQLISYWLFDSTLPNDTPLENIENTYSLTAGANLEFHSALEGYPFNPEHPKWRKASMERRNAPTPINYRAEGNNSIPYENANMRGIQIKQPFTGDGGENVIKFDLPTTGYKDIVFRFAVKDEDAADFLIIEYSINTGQPQWTNAGLANPFPELNDDYQLFEFDFSSIETADDNPNFKIRIRFGGGNLSADDGNRVTFNNFSLDGKPLEGENLPPVVASPLTLQQIIEANEPLEIDLNDVFMDPDNDPLLFVAISNNPQMAQAEISGSVLRLIPERRGEADITIGASDGLNNPVYHNFRVLVYPKPFNLHHSSFAFNAWDADEPEYSYPEYVLFLQSTQNDPGLNESLLYPYYIPHNDYHADDQLTIGFPYNNTGRTRINGLGENGISFINTGRNRDLGGLLLALDTRDIDGVKLRFVTETIQQNERIYGIRLQYRTDINSNFTNFVHNAQYVEYISAMSGDEQLFEEITFAPSMLGHEYLQLLWRYHHVEGNSGARAEIRLDDILLTEITTISELSKDYVSIYAFDKNLVVKIKEPFDGKVLLYDLSGKLIQSEMVSGSDHYVINLRSASGIIIAKVVGEKNVWVEKIFIR